MFQERFQGVDEAEWESKFQQCHQEPGELVVDYAQRLKVLAMRVYENYMHVNPVKLTVMRQFLRGLNGEVQRWVCSKNPKNFDEAFAEARREESNVKLSKQQDRNAGMGKNDVVPKYIEDTIARLELATRRARESAGEEDSLLSAYAGRDTKKLDS